MVETALDLLSSRDVVTLDNERKAAMVSAQAPVVGASRHAS